MLNRYWISKRFTMMAIPTAMFLAACGTTDLMDTNQDNAINSEQVNATIQNVATCKMSQTTVGINVICDGKIVGTLTNGTDGISGKDGVGCSMTELDDGIGYSVKCGDTKGVILNGANGKDGINGKDGVNGTSCETSKIPDGSGVYIICGETAVAVLNGKDGKNGLDGIDGKDGSSCQAEAVDDGFDLYCGTKFIGTILNGKNGADGRDGEDGVNGVDGIDGVDGKSCYATAYAEGDDSGYSLYCADTLVGVILNGKNGADGKDGEDISNAGCSAKAVGDTAVAFVCGKDTVVLNNVIPGEKGKDGESCKIATATDTTITFVCGSDTSTIKAVVNINNTYNNGSLESTTFDPIIVYVSSSSSAKSSSSVTVSISSSSTFDYVISAGVVTGYTHPYPNSYPTIYRGDSVAWHLYTDDTVSISNILNSTYEWRFENGSIESFSAFGTEGLTTPKVMYDEIGLFHAYLSINGGTEITSRSYVNVLPSLIRNCACKEDPDYNNPDSTRWVLSSCSSYAPIIQYEWSGVRFVEKNGLVAYAEKNAPEQAKVSVTNEDGTTKDISCGYIMNDYKGFTFENPGTYYISYACHEYEVPWISVTTSSIGGKATWITNKTSANVDYSTNSTNEIGYDIEYTTLFNAQSKEDAAGLPIVLIIESGTWHIHCGN